MRFLRDGPSVAVAARRPRRLQRGTVANRRIRKPTAAGEHLNHREQVAHRRKRAKALSKSLQRRRKLKRMFPLPARPLTVKVTRGANALGVASKPIRRRQT